MGTASFLSAAIDGSTVIPVVVEADVQQGLPYFRIIGLADREVREARERVRSAIRNSGFSFPMGKITVNLSPSSRPKHGNILDLAIALAVLVAGKKIRTPELRGGWIIGEVGLDGRIGGGPTALAAAIEAWKQSALGCMIAAPVAAARFFPSGLPSIPVSTLREAIDQATSRKTWPLSTPHTTAMEEGAINDYLIDHIRGQAVAKRAVEIAAAGGHHLFMTGPPGIGKSLLAGAISQLLPSVPWGERLGALQGCLLAGEEPPVRAVLRAPSPTISVSDLLGGGKNKKVGELALAKGGVLFLDEFNQLKREVKESLRLPMQPEPGKMHVETGPKDLLVAAQNACPCGMLGAEGDRCRCTPGERARYDRLVSQSVLDRFDLFLSLPEVKGSEVVGAAHRSGQLRKERVMRARKRQFERWGNECLNAQAGDRVVDALQAKKTVVDFLRAIADQLGLSVRGIHKVAAVAQTIADIDGEEVSKIHLQEGVHYRQRRGETAM